MMQPRLDIVIPVYNEGANILRTLGGLVKNLRTPSRVLICYDREDDDTLPVIRENADTLKSLSIEFVHNSGRGAHGAIMTGFTQSRAPYVLVFPADDDYNGVMLDSMVAKAQQDFDIVCASRFMLGGSMDGCPWLKALLVRSANFTLHHIARIPTHDASNGFRLFSRRVIDNVVIESDAGFCYSIELLVKCHRLGWPIGEVPAQWIERREGESRFRVLRWLPAYLRWYLYAFATTFLRRGKDSVPLKSA